MKITQAPYEPVTYMDTEEPITPGDAVIYMLGQEPVEGWVAINPNLNVSWVDELGIRYSGNPLVFLRGDIDATDSAVIYTRVKGQCYVSPKTRKAPKEWVDAEGVLTPQVLAETLRTNKLAERVAKIHGKKKGDGSSVGLFIPLPRHLARKFPSNHPNDSSPSHVTLMILGEIPNDQQEMVLETIKDTLRGTYWTNATAKLQGMDTFETEDSVIPHVQVDFDRDLQGLRHKIRQALREKGLEIIEKHPEFKPHVTLGFLPKDVDSSPTKCPKGQWKFNNVEVWGLPKVHRLPFGTVSKVASAWIRRHG